MGWRKPYMRAFVGGGTGVFAGAQGWYHVASGLFDTCLVVCEEKMSSFYPHAQAAGLMKIAELFWQLRGEAGRVLFVHDRLRGQCALSEGSLPTSARPFPGAGSGATTGLSVHVYDAQQRHFVSVSDTRFVADVNGAWDNRGSSGTEG